MLPKGLIMHKFIITAFFLLTSTFANAQHHHHHHHGHRLNWLSPVIIGGVVGYAIANSARAESPPQVVYIEQPQSYRCPLGSQPIFSTVWVYDRWGRTVPQNQFIGCQ